MTQDKTEIDRRIGSASAILRSSYRSIVTKKEVSQRTRMAIFNTVYHPTLICNHKQWVMTERIRSRIRAAEMRFLRRAASLTLRNRIRSWTIRDAPRAESLLLYIERSQLHWLGYVLRMSVGKTDTSNFWSYTTRKKASRTYTSKLTQLYRVSMSRTIRSFVDRCHCFGQ